MINFDFSKMIPEGLKESFLFTIAMCAFYYLSIILFPNNIPLSNIPFIICTCFCLSLIWLFANYFAAEITVLLILKLRKQETKFRNKVRAGNIASVLFISFSMLLSYLFDLRFKTFIVLSY